MEYIAKQFKPNLDGVPMTWDNYGEWHIDHIKPCSSFDLTCPIQQKLCLEFVEWTLSMDENINNSEIIIIPLINDKKSIVKSSNRIIDSLNMGRFIIINENNQFSEFRNFCYFGNINDGLNWLDNNQKLAISMIKKGQQYVLKKYNYKTVGDKWKTLIEKF